MSTALLAGAPASDTADINRDGRVDVLDFQCAVNQATGAARKAPPANAPAKAPRMQHDELLRRSPCVEDRGLGHALLSAARRASAKNIVALRLHGATGDALPLLGLAPHAPPAA